MQREDLSRELIKILDQSMTLVRQELVTVRNDMMLSKLATQKLEQRVEEISATLEKASDASSADKGNRNAIIVGFGVAIIAAISSVISAILEYWKK